MKAAGVEIDAEPFTFDSLDDLKDLRGSEITVVLHADKDAALAGIVGAFLKSVDGGHGTICWRDRHHCTVSGTQR